MNDYSTHNEKNDYRAPWLRLSKEQMSDPFGWLLSQRDINVRAILRQMGYDDEKQISILIHPNQYVSKRPDLLQARQKIGQKAVQTYLKWAFNNELKESKQPIKINESALRRIITKSVKKVLKESDINNRDFDMSPESVSYRNRNSDGDPKRPLRSLLRTISQCIDTMREVHNGNENFKYYHFEQAEEQAKHAIEKLDELL